MGSCANEFASSCVFACPDSKRGQTHRTCASVKVCVVLMHFWFVVLLFLFARVFPARLIILLVKGQQF